MAWTLSQIAKFMGPTWGPPGSCRPQMGPMLAPWTLLSGVSLHGIHRNSDDSLQDIFQNYGISIWLMQCDALSCSVPHWNLYKKMYLKESSAEPRPFHFDLNVLTSFVMSLSLLAVEFGVPHGGMKLVNNGSCDGLDPDGNSSLLDSTLIQCVFLSLSSMCIYHYHHSFISILCDLTLGQCVLIRIIIDYLLVSSLN